MKAHGERLAPLVAELKALGLHANGKVTAVLDALDGIDARRLKTSYSLPDGGRAYLALLAELSADPQVWRLP